MADKKKRSIAKAVSWRLMAFILLSLISFVTTGDIKTASYIAILYNTIQLFVFFVHERGWEHIRWGQYEGLFIQMTGLSGAGKTTLAMAVAHRLRKRGFQIEIIDGDEYRQGLCSDLGFSKEDRNTNIKRLGFVGKVLGRNNVIAIMSAINPYQDIRESVGGKVVYIKCDLETVVERDVKGLYALALLPEGNPKRINNFTGISDPYEAPMDADLVINTQAESLEESVRKLETFILESA